MLSAILALMAIASFLFRRFYLQRCGRDNDCSGRPDQNDPGVSDLADYERDSTSGLGAGEHSGTITGAVHLEPRREADHDVFPAHIAPKTFFQLDNVNARMDGRTGFKTSLERCFFGGNLGFELLQSVAEREKQLKLKLRDWFY